MKIPISTGVPPEKRIDRIDIAAKNAQIANAGRHARSGAFRQDLRLSNKREPLRTPLNLIQNVPFRDLIDLTKFPRFAPQEFASRPGAIFYGVLPV